MSSYTSLLAGGEFNPDVNFWKAFPQFKHLGIFKDILKKDKNRTKKKSSDMMWFIALCYDPASPLANNPVEGEMGNKVIVSRDFIGDANYYIKYSDEIDPVAEFYLDLIETPAVKSLRLWEKKMKERDKFIMDTPYSMGTPDENGKLVGSTANDLDKMLANTPKLYEQLSKIKANIEEENKTKGVNDRKVSASDSGIL